VQVDGLQKFSLIDYPNKIATIVFTKGCNFLCPYCHNPELIGAGQGKYSTNKILEFLKTRIGLLDAVTITGGEPFLQSYILEFIKQIKEMDFLVKVDTNGSFPDKLQKIISHVDYIAMDIKAPFIKYSEVVGVKIDIGKIKKSIKIIKESSCEFEFRTTVVHPFLDKEDILQIYRENHLKYNYYLQNFSGVSTLSKEKMWAFSKDELNFIQDRIHCRVR